MNIIPDFVLASASPARRKLLQMVGIEPIVCQSNFDESQIELTDAERLVNTLAKCKAETVIDRFGDALVLGCDSVLKVNGRIYGKPESPAMAIARWQSMRGNKGILFSIEQIFIEIFKSILHFLHILNYPNNTD